MKIDIDHSDYRQYQRFLSGDLQGFEQIVKIYREMLILFIRQYVGDYHAAEDIAQDVFVKLYLKKPRYSPKASFKTWLYTIAKRETLNYLKKQSRQTHAEGPAEGEDGRDYLESILADKRKIVLHDALESLPPEYRRVLYLHYFEDFSVNEIGALLQKRSSQISDLLYNAKKALKSVILKGGNQYEILRGSVE